MGKDELNFSIYIISALSEAWVKTPMKVYSELTYTDVLEGYIIANYEVLHTLGEEYLVEDITALVKEKRMKMRKKTEKER